MLFSATLLFTISSVAFSKLSDSILSVENGIVSLGVDLNRGCSIAKFIDLSSGVNMINDADLGRETQASFYSGPNNYGGCIWSDQAWPWNPIGSGDVYGNPSEVLSHSVDGSSITCSIIPMQWACNNVPCECTFNMTYSIKDSAVYASVTLINHRSDHTEYGAMDQEFPAVYVNGFLYRLFSYTGDAPWTHAPLQEFDAGFDTWWVPGHVKATESFLLFASDDNFAVGVYNSGNDVENIIAGFFGEKGSGGENDNPTGYMAPSGQVSLAWNEQYTYEYCLIMGNIDTVRNYVYQLHESEVLHGSNGLKKHFNIDVELAPAANVQPSAINSNKTRVSGIHGVEASLIPHGIAKK